jgi:hypothetical protein
MPLYSMIFKSSFFKTKGFEPERAAVFRHIANNFFARSVRQLGMNLDCDFDLCADDFWSDAEQLPLRCGPRHGQVASNRPGPTRGNDPFGAPVRLLSCSGNSKTPWLVLFQSYGHLATWR